MIRLLVIALLLITPLMSGCTALKQGAAKAMMPASQQQHWPTPESLGFSLQAQQVLTINHGDDSHTMTVALEVNPQKLTLVALSPVGVPIAIITWDGVKLDKQSPTGMDISVIPFELILDSIFYSYWPEAALEAMLDDSNWQLQQTYDTNLATSNASQTSLIERKVLQNNKLILEINYKKHRQPQGQINLVDHRTKLATALTTIQWIQS
ncbi:DUF3261 domain-containing protein [Shewanella maritima]|uniref:DUF3261 domain-containing protein n=1 Tax=Shewanella maritima TaxID=2520507 RepID=A0A411PEM4_9GAMM|nr:DUF3261 domain-containing protein [Shewanella maritima]QBF81983.1 DUF3261 domain-containing protein [Shewanella maritima]